MLGGELSSLDYKLTFVSTPAASGQILMQLTQCSDLTMRQRRVSEMKSAHAQPTVCSRSTSQPPP